MLHLNCVVRKQPLQSQIRSTYTIERLLALICEDDSGTSSQSWCRMWVRVQRVRRSGGSGATGAGRRLAGPHLLRPHHAGRPGRELAGHPRGHQAPADEDRHQPLHR